VIRARDCSGNTGSFPAGKAEELEWKARFPALGPEMRPKKETKILPPYPADLPGSFDLNMDLMYNISTMMKRLFLLIGVCAIGIMACESLPEPQAGEPAALAEPAAQAPAAQAPAPQVNPAPVEPEPVREGPSFDYTHITEEIRVHTRAEIQELIGELDGIIESEDYHAWIASLDETYLKRISSSDFLAAQSQSPRLKSQESLKNVEEYFKKVVVPARANTDYRIADIDIQFVPEEEKVLAFLTTAAGRRLRLYELKNVNGTWKIAN
jgi:hypothetical protein